MGLWDNKQSGETRNNAPRTHTGEMGHNLFVPSSFAACL